MLFTLSALAEEKIIQSSIPFSIEDNFNEDLPVLIDQGTSAIKVQSQSLIKALKPYVIPSIIYLIEQKSTVESGNKWITVSDLNRIGLDAKYDSSSFNLKINIPLIYKTVQPISVIKKGDPLAEDVTVNDASGYINFFANQPYGTMGNSNLSPNGHQNLYGNVDGALNVKDFVFESQFDYLENNYFRRGDTRLVKDDPDSLVRYSLGDINALGGGFFQSQHVGGFGAITSYSLNPSKNINPQNNYEITLKRPSVIKIIANDRPLQSFSLPPGKYDIRDMPLAVGLNDVTLEVTDDTGYTERIQLPTFSFNQKLLGKDIHEISYVIGLPVDDSDPHNRQYKSDNMTVSASHRYGLTDRITIGGYTQDDPYQGIWGLGTSYSSEFGVFSLEEAGSSLFQSNFVGAGSRFDYQYQKSNGKNFQFGYQTMSKHFMTLGNLDYVNKVVHELNASYGQPLFAGLRGSLSGRYGFARYDGDPNVYDVTLGIAKPIKNMTTDLLFSQSKLMTGQVESVVKLFITWSFGSTTVSSSVSSNKDATVHVRSDDSSDKIDKFVVDYLANATPTSKDSDLRVDYIGNRGRAYLGEQVLKNGSEQTTSKTTVGGGTALVFAGNAVTLSQPINNSFVLVRPEGKVKKEEIIVNPRTDGEMGSDARTDFIGPAVLNNVIPYQPIAVNVELKNYDKGLSLPKPSYIVKPHYKSGTLIELKSESNVTIRGNLVGDKGIPLPTESGEIRSVTEKSFEPVFFFSNKEGFFNVEGLKSGQYKLQLFDSKETTIEFTIPDNYEGFYDIQLKANRKQ